MSVISLLCRTGASMPVACWDLRLGHILITAMMGLLFQTFPPKGGDY